MNNCVIFSRSLDYSSKKYTYTNRNKERISVKCMNRYKQCICELRDGKDNL